MRFPRLALAALAAAAASACGGTTEPTDAPLLPDQVAVRDNAFGPQTLTVPVNTTVTWLWRGHATHDVSFADAVHSPAQSSGSYQRAFTTAGTYDYICTIHGAAMSGRVVVQ